MIRRILMIELRRSAILATLVGTGAVLVGIGAVRDGMNSVAAAQREGLMFLGALALAIGAWRAGRDRRSRILELLGTTARPRWQRLLMIAAAYAIGPVTGYLVAYTAVTAYATAIGAYVPVGAVVAGAVTAGYLAALFWLGLAIGRALPFVVVPPLVVVVGFVVAAFLAISADLEGYAGRTPPGTVLLNPMQLEGFESFETLSAAAQLAQTAWAVAIAAAALLLFVASRYARLAAVGPVVLGLAIAMPMLPSDVDDAIVPDRGALALECTSDEPRVCVRRVHIELLDELRDPGREALSILAGALPQAPTTVVELVAEDAPLLPAPDILFAEVHTCCGGEIEGTEQDLMWTLLMGAGTRACLPEDLPLTAIDSQYAARLIAAAWLLGEEPGAVTGQWSIVAELPEITPAYEAFAALSAGVQRDRVAALREAELACDGRDRLALLTGAG